MWIFVTGSQDTSVTPTTHLPSSISNVQHELFSGYKSNKSSGTEVVTAVILIAPGIIAILIVQRPVG